MKDDNYIMRLSDQLLGKMEAKRGGCRFLYDPTAFL